MKTSWTIDCVGASEEDEAHLRLLLRSSRKQLVAEWVWGEESEADLVFVEGRDAPSEAAVARAVQRKALSARIVGADDPEPAGLFLRKPLHRDPFSALLNLVAFDMDAADAVGVSASADTPPIASGPEQPSTPPADAAPVPPAAASHTPSAADNAMHALLHYLPKRVLGGAARIALPGLPPLVIDPEARTFWADGLLPALEPYARDPLRFGDWKPLDAAELEQARAGVAARPFAYLTWMDTLIHSKGVLSRRLDPEGTYSLTKRLDLANDYPRALRISAQMTRPRRLQDIARASGVDLAEVFDVVNAYEAIGYLEWSRSGAAPARRS